MDFRACSDEIPPCSFETARRLLWRNINNELLPVYDRQLCECYLQPQILRCECLGDNKWVLNQKPLIIAQAFTTSITQIWVKPSGIPQIWVNPQIWAITQNWGNHAQVTQNWVLHLFLRVVIYLFIAHYLMFGHICRQNTHALLTQAVSAISLWKSRGAYPMLTRLSVSTALTSFQIKKAPAVFIQFFRYLDIWLERVQQNYLKSLAIWIFISSF